MVCDLAYPTCSKPQGRWVHREYASIPLCNKCWRDSIFISSYARDGYTWVPYNQPVLLPGEEQLVKPCSCPMDLLMRSGCKCGGS